MFENFLVAFIPLFFALDALGILPAFLTITTDMSIMKRRSVVNQATITGVVISLFFIYGGKVVFKLLGITVPDFKIAGGMLLLVFSIQDLLFSNGNSRSTGKDDDTVGIVPVGTPLIIGPATLTTLLLLVDKAGYNMTILSLAANMLLVWIVFYFSDSVIRVIRRPGAIAIGKVFQLFLAAIAVMMIRNGITEIIKG